jgi:predicted  nucleic acid-binding Zn-ribbon protein
VSGVYGPVPLSAPRSFPLAEEDSRQVAAIEKGRDPELFRRNVEDALARVVQEKLPEAELSDREIAQLAQTIRTLSESIAGLQELERTPENAAAIEALAGRIQQESRRIEEATGMSATAFLNRITTEGIDNEKPEKGDVVLEYLDSPGR